ncbi:MAG: (Fe-S)-binding protein, partial [Anaerolineae bacterium]|nr:(Fe-S)-binding protein [Anaerolineae bacterium]
LNVLQLLDGDACTECGRCQAACPAYMAGTPLNPKQIILDIRAGLDRYSPVLLNGGGSTTPLTREIISPDALWACTTCRACVHECPVLIEHVDSIVDMRRYLALTEGDVPDLLGMAMQQAERAGNPWGNPKGSRMDWAAELDVPVIAQKKKADVLYWVGCAGAYDPESQKTARAVVQILQAAGVDFAVLGEEERCNCEWARRAGNEYLFQEATHSNIAVMDKYEFNVVLTHCPHCFNTFKNEYPQFGGDYTVVHHSAYIAGLIYNGQLKLTKPLNEVVTYHDSCYLGRYNDLYEDPRLMLRSVQGITTIEMERSRDRGLCCGGGGAQVWFETHQEIPVNQIRLNEALETGAQTISTACPFCTIMLGSAAQSAGVAEQVKVQDVAVIVAGALA